MATITSNLDKSEVPGAVSAVAGASHYVRWGKRLFDIAASLAGLAIFSPLLILVALLVRLTSCGPVLFRQTRIGYLGRPFTLIKFRTMVQGAEALGSSVVVARDPRLTPLGPVLRRTKLDEFPQLFNVLRGDMSFVGPRPRVPSEVDRDDHGERILQRVRPGVTSYASIHHRREADYCARQANPQAVFSTNLLPQKRSLDCEYVQNLTFRLDLKLLFLTFVLLCVPGKSITGGVKIFGQEVRLYSREAQMLIDLVLYIMAVWLAYTFRYEEVFPPFYNYQMWVYILIIPPLQVLVNRFLGIYDMMWRYVTQDDAAYVALALAPVTFALFGLRLALPASSWKPVILMVPLSIITLEYLLALSAGLGLRGLRRALYTLHHHYQPLPARSRRVMILGAGLRGLTMAQEIRQHPHLSLVGFLDDDPAKDGRLLAGYRILGSSAKLEMLCARHHVTNLMVCAQAIDPHRLLELYRRCEILRVRVHILPSLDRALRDASDPLLTSSGFRPSPVKEGEHL